jgi:hypothetical protein
MAQSKHEEKTYELEKAMVADKSKSGLVEKLVFILLPICVSAIGWLLTQVNTLNNEITILNNKINIVVNAENKAIPPQGTTIELETLRANAAQSRADMKMEINDKITEVQINAMQERADIKARLSVLESRMNNRK